MKKGTLARIPNGRRVVILCRPNVMRKPEWIVHDGRDAFRVEEKSAKVLGYLVRMKKKGDHALYGLRGAGKMIWTPAQGDRMMERREIVRELNSREGES